MTTTLYRVGAYFEYDGQRLGGDLPEVLGDAYGRYYATETEAQEVADDLQDSVDECGLDESTTYTVEPVEVSVSDVSAERDSESDIVEVSARVSIDHDYPVLVVTYGSDRHTAAGIDGLIPAGDEVSAWVDQDLANKYGTPIAMRVCEEILAGAHA